MLKSFSCTSEVKLLMVCVFLMLVFFYPLYKLSDVAENDTFKDYQAVGTQTLL